METIFLFFCCFIFETIVEISERQVFKKILFLLVETVLFNFSDTDLNVSSF